MNLSHLRYFREAARLGSLSGAARKHRVTQSAVSQAIRALEAWFDEELLVHGKRRFELTEAGRELYERSAGLLEEIELLRTGLGATAKEPHGPLHLAAPQSLVSEALWPAIIELRARHRKVKVHVLTGAAYHVKALVENRECDLGVVLDDLKLEGFASQTIFSGKFVLVSKSGSIKALKERGVLCTDQLKPEIAHLMKTYRQHAGHELPIDLEVMSWTLLKRLALTKDGVAYLPDYLVRDELRKGSLREVRLPGLNYTYEIKAIWKQGVTLRPAAESFLKFLF